MLISFVGIASVGGGVTKTKYPIIIPIINPTIPVTILVIVMPLAILLIYFI
jgi:hypothetical protein